MQRSNKFGRKGCFTCGSCGKRTREVDANQGLELCELCAVKIGAGNSLSDVGYNGPADPWKMFDACKDEAEIQAILDVELAKLAPCNEPGAQVDCAPAESSNQ